MHVPDKYWALWIHRSLALHFQTLAVTNDIAFYIRGVDNTSESSLEFIEFHNGDLKVTQISSGHFKINVPVIVAYSVDNSTNIQRDKEISGLILESLDKVCVYKYGDDTSFVGGMLPDQIAHKDLGKIDQIRRGLIEVIYTLYIKQ